MPNHLKEGRILTLLPIGEGMVGSPRVGGYDDPIEVRPVMMNEKPCPTVSPLAQVEMETLAEGREWMRRRLQSKFQRLAHCQGAIPPPSATSRCGP